MKSFTHYLVMNIPSKMAFENITPQVEEIVRKSGIDDGLCFVSPMHITAAIYVNDNEDGLMEDIITSRLRQEDCAGGYLLDGYPRTLQQAQWYYAHYGQPTAILLDVPEDEVMRRIAARNEGRPDDGDAHIVTDRLEEYSRFTAPLIGYYSREAKMYRVDGTIGIDNVFNAIKNFLESKEAVAYG